MSTIMQYGMIVDITRCIGCYVCVIACKDQFVENEYLPYSTAQPDTGHFWIKGTEIVRGKYPKVKASYLFQPCMHCDDPPCVRASSNGAVYKRNDGVVIIDPVKSKDKTKITPSCPYERIYWNDQKAIPQKCTWCAHRLDESLLPACVNVCPTQALIFGEMEELSGIIAERNAEQLYPEWGTSPRVYYIGLPKTFLAGKVVDDRTGKYLEGAKVSVTSLDTSKTLVVSVDNYGDFEFDGLTTGITWEVKVEKEGYRQKKLDPIHLKTDLYIGKIRLARIQIDK